MEGQRQADWGFPVIVSSRRRLVVLYVLVAALLLTLVGRLWYVQVMSGTVYTRLAADNQTRNVIIPSVRGQILDDLGRPLVSNRTSLVVSVQPTVLATLSDGGAAVLKRLAGVLGLPFRRHTGADTDVHGRRGTTLLAGLALPADPGRPAGA